MNAQMLTQRQGGRWYGGYGTAPCPVCQPDARRGQNALTLRNGRARLLLHCKKSGCTFADILAAAGISPGTYSPPSPSELARREAEEQVKAEKTEKRALAVWRRAVPIRGTIAETYLRQRAITCTLPDTLRFHPDCWHPTAKRFSAMLALIEGLPRLAIHRTYLRPDGGGKAPADPPKAMLGAALGGAVRLTNGQGPLVVAEGVETALSLSSGLLRHPATVWACLSTAGMAGLRLPDRPHRLIIATDGDQPGKAAGHKLAERAAALGWAVSILPAPEGRDWNDVLMMKGAAA